MIEIALVGGLKTDFLRTILIELLSKLQGFFLLSANLYEYSLS